MHLLHDKPVNAVIAIAGFLFLGIFLMFATSGEPDCDADAHERAKDCLDPP